MEYGKNSMLMFCYDIGLLFYVMQTNRKNFYKQCTINQSKLFIRSWLSFICLPAGYEQLVCSKNKVDLLKFGNILSLKYTDYYIISTNYINIIAQYLNLKYYLKLILNITAL